MPTRLPEAGRAGKRRTETHIDAFSRVAEALMERANSARLNPLARANSARDLARELPAFRANPRAPERWYAGCSTVASGAPPMARRKMGRRSARGQSDRSETVMTRLLPILLAPLLALIATQVAHAKTRVTVHEFFGPHAGALRAETEQILKGHDGLLVISKADVDAAAHNLGVDLLSPDGRKTMARELELAAWVTGIVRKQGGRLQLTVVVYDGAEHNRVGRTVLEGRSVKNLQDAVKRNLWQKSKDAILLALAPLPPGRAPIEDEPLPPGRAPIASDAPKANALPVTSTPPVAAVAPPTEAEPLRTPTSSAAPPEASSSSMRVVMAPSTGARPDAALDPSKQTTRREALHAVLGIGSPYRKLAYSDALTPSLGDYQLAGMPMLDLSVVYYPGRTFTERWPSWFGIDLAGQFGLGGGASADREGNRFRARYDAYRAGLRVRAPIKRHFVSIFSGYAIQRLSFSSETKGLAAPTPDVDYRMVRTGAGTELALTQALGLGFDAAWLHVLSVGEIGRWFPRASAGAFELALNVSYALGHRMFARLTGLYQRTAFDFHAKPGDRKIAGGATDQVLTASLGIGVAI
jgi:hypothetical protein